MDSFKVRYYILFINFEQGLALHSMLDSHKLPNRIAPAPRAIQGELSCGMSLLIEEEDINNVKRCIKENNGEYYDIIPLSGQLHPFRDKYL